MSTDVTHLISLGAGVQSSTMALMAAHGEIEPMPKAAIFADTQSEPTSVYEWLDWLETQLPFPVHRVSRGELGAAVLSPHVSTKTGRTFSKVAIPTYLENMQGQRNHNRTRACTVKFKLRVINREVRKIAGIKRGEKHHCVTQWLGISTDEITRAKEHREPWCRNRFPLMEKRMSRATCYDWMRNHGYPEPPRSACVFCAYRSGAEWRDMQKKEPQSFAEAVSFERSLQEFHRQCGDPYVPYLHKSCKPLDTIDFRSDVERGQKLLPGWQDECEGMCGI